MYNYPQYKEKDREKIIAFMRQYPFVMLVGCDRNQRMVCTQIPVLVDEKEGKLVITGHMAKKSDHETAFRENPRALMVFTGPHTYVSGTWYAGNPQQASTWNYIAIHARGELKWMEEAGLIELLRRLSLHFENNDAGSSTIYDNLPPSYKDKLVKAIIGFELEVTELENVHKLSQNRDEISYRNIIAKLEEQGGDGKYIADRMKENTSELFTGKEEAGNPSR